MFHLFNIHYILTTFGYTGIFLTVFFDSGVLLPVPGDILLFTAGIFCLTLGFNIFALIIIAFIATIFGAMAGYQIGVHLIRLEKFPFFQRFLNKENIAKAHKFFANNGKTAVILSRFFPVIRTFVPIAAGVARMNYASFIKYNLAVSATWSSLLVLLGFFLGHLFPHAKGYIFTILSVVVVISLLPVLFGRSRMRKKE